MIPRGSNTRSSLFLRLIHGLIVTNSSSNISFFPSPLSFVNDGVIYQQQQHWHHHLVPVAAAVSARR